MASDCYEQGGRFAAAADEPEGEPEELPLDPPLMPELGEPLPVALPEVLGVPEELPLVEALPLLPEPELAVLSCTLPCASLQCVAAETLPLAPELLGEVDDWPTAASMPPARNADASRTVLRDFMVVLLGV